MYIDAHSSYGNFVRRMVMHSKYLDLQKILRALSGNPANVIAASEAQFCNRDQMYSPSNFSILFYRQVPLIFSYFTSSIPPIFDQFNFKRCVPGVNQIY